MISKISKKDILNYICIILSISIISASDIQTGRYENRMIHIAITLVIPAAVYAAYAYLAKKFISRSRPLFWMLALVIADVASGTFYFLQNMQDVKFEHYILFLIRFTPGAWLTCMIVYLVEWIATPREALVDGSRVFRNLGMLAVFLFLAYFIISVCSGLIFHHRGGPVAAMVIYLLFGGFKLFNAFEGISNGKFDRYLGKEGGGGAGSTTTYFYRRITGDEAVISGIRSALLWLGVGALYFKLVGPISGFMWM